MWLHCRTKASLNSYNWLEINTPTGGATRTNHVLTPLNATEELALIKATKKLKVRVDCMCVCVCARSFDGFGG